MKLHHLNYLLALLTVAAVLAAVARAEENILEWDPNPPGQNVTEYTLFRIVPDAEPEKLGTVPYGTNEITVDLEVGDTVALKAYSLSGGSSDFSEPLTITATPDAPKGLRVTVTVTVELSTMQAARYGPSEAS